jgi:hypothetical protein
MSRKAPNVGNPWRFLNVIQASNAGRTNLRARLDSGNRSCRNTSNSRTARGPAKARTMT